MLKIAYYSIIKFISIIDKRNYFVLIIIVQCIDHLKHIL